MTTTSGAAAASGGHMTSSFYVSQTIPEDGEQHDATGMVRKLRDELDRVKIQLKRSQDMVRELENRNLEMKNLEENPNVAIRQIRAVERRLKVTEDRLNRERADRASKLTDVEEKLIGDNARLKVVESDLKRKLSRETNRVQSLEKRVKDLREENEALSISLMNSPPSVVSVLNDDGSINKVPLKMNMPEYRKGSDEWAKLIRYIQSEEKVDQMEEIVHRLWYQKDTALKQLAIWEQQLAKLGQTREEISASLKDMAVQREAYEQRINVLLQECDDSKRSKENAETTMNERLATLVREKHEAAAQMQLLEDKFIAMEAERDALKLAPAGGGGGGNVEVVYKYIDRPASTAAAPGPCPKCEAAEKAGVSARQSQALAPAEAETMSTQPGENRRIEQSAAYQDHTFSANNATTIEMTTSTVEMSAAADSSAVVHRPSPNSHTTQGDPTSGSIQRVLSSSDQSSSQIPTSSPSVQLPASGVEEVAMMARDSAGPQLMVPPHPTVRPGQDSAKPLSGSSAILDEQIMLLNKDLDNNRQKIQLLKSENAKRQKELLSLQTELVSRIKQQKVADEMNKKLIQEKADLKQKCDELEKDVAKLKEDLLRKSKELADLNFKYTQLEDEFKAAKLHLHKKSDQFAKTDAELLEVKQILMYKESATEDLNRKLRELDKKVQSADQVKDSELRSQKELDLRAINSLEAEIADLKIQLQIADQNATAYRDEKQKLLCEMLASGVRKERKDRHFSWASRLGSNDESETVSNGQCEDSPAFRALRAQLVKTETELDKLELENSRLKEIIRKSEMSLDSDKDIDTSSMSYPNLSYRSDSTDEIDKLQKEREVAEARHNRTLSQLKSAELSLTHSNETREQLRRSLAELEEAVDFLKGQLHRETAAKKEAERRVENLLIDLNGKSLNEDQIAVHKANLAKAETDVVMMRKTVDDLNDQVGKLKSRTSAYETELKAIKRKLKEKTLQFETLQAQFIDAKDVHDTTTKSLTDSYSTRLQESEKDGKRKENECKQLKTELKNALHKITAKGEEILKLKEEIYTLQEQLSSVNNRVSPNISSQQMDDMASVMEEVRNLKLEKDELVTAVHDLRRRLAKETQRSSSSSPDLGLVPHQQQQNLQMTNELKIRLDDLKYRLQTEKKMHDITQQQLKNIWQDNDSLRQRLIDAKRNGSMDSGGRRGSRLNEINEIIARSGEARCIMGTDEGVPNGLCGSPTVDMNRSDSAPQKNEC